MVACGVGLYIPYVAFHTAVFERLIATARMPANLGFVMYLADSIGYLGYAGVMVVRTQGTQSEKILPFFLVSPDDGGGTFTCLLDRQPRLLPRSAW